MYSIEQPERFTGRDITNMISAIHHFTDETSRIYSQYNNEPAISSIALQEQTQFPNCELARGVHYTGVLSMEAAADHLMVFTDSLLSRQKLWPLGRV